MQLYKKNTVNLIVSNDYTSTCEICGFHGGEDVSRGLLGCDAM